MPGCPHTALFFNLSRMKIMSRATSDVTRWGHPPAERHGYLRRYGASITIMLGMEKALEKAGKSIRQVAVIGDSTFFHSGITGLIDVIYSQGKSTVIILDNSITAMTGHQENPGSGRTLTGESAPRLNIQLVKEGLAYVIPIRSTAMMSKASGRS